MLVSTFSVFSSLEQFHFLCAIPYWIALLRLLQAILKQLVIYIHETGGYDRVTFSNCRFNLCQISKDLRFVEYLIIILCITALGSLCLFIIPATKKMNVRRIKRWQTKFQTINNSSWLPWQQVRKILLILNNSLLYLIHPRTIKNYKWIERNSIIKIGHFQ